MRRVPIAPPGDIFWGQELVGEELLKTERGYPSEGLLEIAHFFYVCTLIPQLINVVSSDFMPPAPPPQVDPAQPSSSRGGTLQASYGHLSSRVSSFDPLYFLALASSYPCISIQQTLLVFKPLMSCK